MRIHMRGRQPTVTCRALHAGIGETTRSFDDGAHGDALGDSRSIADLCGIGSSPTSGSTSLRNLGMFVVQDAAIAHPNRGIAASPAGTTPGQPQDADRCPGALPTRSAQPSTSLRGCAYWRATTLPGVGLRAELLHPTPLRTWTDDMDRNDFPPSSWLDARSRAPTQPKRHHNVPVGPLALLEARLLLTAEPDQSP